MRLLTLSNEEIVGLLNSYEKESKALKQSLFKLCWYMRGGITYDEMIQLGFKDRELINNVIKENIEVTNETRLPFF